MRVSFAECCSGERNDSSHWANIEIGGSHQNLIKLVWCLYSCALVTGGIQSAKQNEPSVFLFQSQTDTEQQTSTSSGPHTETDTDWENICTLFIVTQQIPHTICWKQSRPYSLPLTQMIVSHFHLQLPWQHKFTFMRGETADLMGFSSIALTW